MTVRRPAARRPGQVALITLFAVMTLVLLIAAVLNVSRVTATKVEQQTAADAAAHAAGVELARGLNAVTALNHLITELNAQDALAMSFGGLELEDKKPVMLLSPADRLTMTAALADATLWSGGTRPAATQAATTATSKSGGAIGDSRKRLLGVLRNAYRVHAAGGVMATAPGLEAFASAGRELVRSAGVIEESVEHEWQVLGQLEELAETKLIPLKQLCNHGTPDKPDEMGIIPRLYAYCERVVEETLGRAEAAAARVAEEHGAAGSLFPNTRAGPARLELPVEKEVIHRGSADHERSQMVRGMTPWVQLWRKPILEYGRRVLPLSGFAEHFHRHSNEFTLNMAWWQWEENRTRLYRLKDLNVTGRDKGREEWAREDGFDRANELFGVLGFAHKPPPEVTGFPVFRQPQPDGMAAVAQVLVYNANRQDRPRVPKWQPVVGWDTLAWDDPVPEFEFGKEFGSDRAIRRTDQPRVRLNWQAKLVPVASKRLADAAGTQAADLNRVLDRLVTDRPLSNTH